MRTARNIGAGYIVSVGVLAGLSATTESPVWYAATVAATLPLGIGFPVALFFILGLLAAVLGLDLDGSSASWPLASFQVGLSACLWMGLAWVNAKVVSDFVGDCRRRRLARRSTAA